MPVCRACTRVVVDGCDHAALDDANDSVMFTSVYCTTSAFEVTPDGTI